MDINLVGLFGRFAEMNKSLFVLQDSMSSSDAAAQNPEGKNYGENGQSYKGEMVSRWGTTQLVNQIVH